MMYTSVYGSDKVLKQLQVHENEKHVFLPSGFLAICVDFFVFLLCFLWLSYYKHKIFTSAVPTWL